MISKRSCARWQATCVLLLTLALLVAQVPGAPASLADGGDFSVNFAAAAPRTYSHNEAEGTAPPDPPPTYGAWPGGGAWNDGTSKGEDADLREELEASSFKCEDTVTFLAQIVTDASPTAYKQKIELAFAFLLDTTGQPGAGLVSTNWGGDPVSSGGDTHVAINYGQVEGGDDGTPPGVPYVRGLDSGISDDRQVATGDTGVGGSTATVVDQYFRDKQGDREDDPAFNGGVWIDLSELVVVVRVDDLQANETVILRIDTKIACQPGSNPTANLQAKYESGYVIEEMISEGGQYTPVIPPDAIGSGAQTIPFKKVGDLTFETDYKITKECAALANPSESFDYVLNVFHEEGSVLAATFLEVTDPLPSAVRFDAVSTSRDSICGIDGCCSYDLATHTVTCNLDLLELGGAWTITISVTVLTDTGTANNTATVADNDGRLVDKDHTNNFKECVTTTFITLASFQAKRIDDRVRFEWSTGTEAGNVGFHLYSGGPWGQQRVNAELVPSAVVNSVEPQDYVLEMSGVEGSVFYIEDVDILGRTRLHGPFELGEPYGARVKVDPIDWAAIRAEHVALEAEREAERRAEVQARIDLVVRSSPHTVYLPLVSIGAGRGAEAERVAAVSAPPGKSVSVASLLVKQTGLYRVTYEDLRTAGFDLSGIRASHLALTNRGVPMPIYVRSSGPRLGAGAYLEFYGQALDTLYTTTNVYDLWVDPSLAQRVTTDATAPNLSAQPVPFYMETATVDDNVAYAFYSPTGDPWYKAQILAYTSPVERVFDLDAEGLVAGAAPSTLSLQMWGVTDWADDPDHHVVVLFNGVEVADEYFDGNDSRQVSVELGLGAVKEWDNALMLRVPGDTGVKWDMVDLDRFSVTYPRAFVARDDRLSFKAAGALFQVDGLSSADVAVYRLDEGGLTRLSEVLVEDVGAAYRATFAGAGAPATYLLSTVEALLAPTMKAGRPQVDIKSGRAQYLMITHPSFEAGLEPLVAAREAEGYQVRVVDVEEIYAQFGYGILDPQAIQEYIGYAAASMDTEYVLLVGGDSYDYLDYLTQGSVSFIPSLYAQTDDIVRYAPVDPLYVDLDEDGLPDLPIGRFPVRKVAELELLVAKTLDYGNKNYDRTSVFAADDGFASDSWSFIGQLPDGWVVETAHIDDLNLVEARNRLLGALNGGVALASYVGHSGPTNWTYDGLFRAVDAAALTNHGRPTVVTQWGCWNTYHVAPKYNTLGHKFLLSGDQGAVAVLGATALSLDSSERALGRLLVPKLAEPGMTIGVAIQDAKADLGATQVRLVDVLLGWTLLGDPTLVVQP